MAFPRVPPFANDVDTLGADTFNELEARADAALLGRARNLADVADAAAARFNLGVPELPQAQAVVAADHSLSGIPGSGVTDGYSAVPGDRLLVIGQADPAENGVWVVPVSGAWTRPTDFPAGSPVTSRSILIAAGNEYAGTRWDLVLPASIMIGSDPQVWTLPPIQGSQLPPTVLQGVQSDVGNLGASHTLDLEAMPGGLIGTMTHDCTLLIENGRPGQQALLQIVPGSADYQLTLSDGGSPTATVMIPTNVGAFIPIMLNVKPAGGIRATLLSLPGPQGTGTAGHDGAPGQRGSFTYFGVGGPPGTILGLATNDVYFDLSPATVSTAGQVWQYDGLEWVLQGSILGPQGPPGLPGEYVRFTGTGTNTYTVPDGVAWLMVEGVGSSGGSGGSGSATTQPAQVGGGGSAAGVYARRIIAVTGGETITGTVGNGGAGGVGGAAGGNNPGTDGVTGDPTSLVDGSGNPLLVANGGSKGAGSPGNSTLQAGGGVYGVSPAGLASTTLRGPSCGGPSGTSGGEPASGGGGGGEGGAPPSGAFGGRAGANGSQTAGGSPGTAGPGSSTANGVDATPGAPGTGAGVGGGGAAAPGGRGGNGAQGASGWWACQPVG